MNKNTTNSEKPFNGKLPLIHQNDDQILILREGEEDFSHTKRRKWGKEDFQILKVFTEELMIFF